MMGATTTSLDRIDIGVDELRAMLEDGRPVTVLDVRDADQRDEWSIPGSIHADAYEALKAGDTDALADLSLSTAAPVVTVCGAGHVSLFAGEQLRARGIPARSLTGGMRAWSLAWNSAEVPVLGSPATVVQIRRTGKGCLSYLLGAGGEAVVIDASLDPAVYAELASRYGWTIAQVLDTHVHADHLSRAPQLAAITGATLRLPAQDRVTYPFVPVADGDIVQIGAARLAALRTPGHTLESTSYLLDGRALFSGDTLFLAGVGRPDLDASVEEARARARLLYGSLRELMVLPVETAVLPAHTSGPVAFDGVPVTAPLGRVMEQVRTLRLGKEEFVDTILARIPPTPPNHARIVALNETGERPAGDLTDLEAGANRCAVS